MILTESSLSGEALGVYLTGDAFPRLVITTPGTLYFGDGTIDPTSAGHINAFGYTQSDTLLLEGSNGITLQSDSAGGNIGGIDLLCYDSTGIAIVVKGSTNNANIEVSNSGTGNVVLNSVNGSVVIVSSAAGKLSFFGKTPAVGPQVSGGTLAGVIAGLVALGLFSS